MDESIYFRKCWVKEESKNTEFEEEEENSSSTDVIEPMEEKCAKKNKDVKIYKE